MNATGYTVVNQPRLFTPGNYTDIRLCLPPEPDQEFVLVYRFPCGRRSNCCKIAGLKRTGRSGELLKATIVRTIAREESLRF
jgi:hypothetical protein